jgi:hypothetical protein
MSLVIPNNQKGRNKRDTAVPNRHLVVRCLVEFYRFGTLLWSQVFMLSGKPQRMHTLVDVVVSSVLNAYHPREDGFLFSRVHETTRIVSHRTTHQETRQTDCPALTSASASPLRNEFYRTQRNDNPRTILVLTSKSTAMVFIGRKDTIVDSLSQGLSLFESLR